MDLTLRSFSLPNQTIGFLEFEEPFMDLAGLWTIEQPWNDNQRYVSCIPPDRYDLVDYSSEKYPNTWALVGTHVSLYEEPDVARFTCLFHIANWATNVEGCIGPGLNARSALNRKTGQIEASVGPSGRAMDVMRQLLRDGEEHSVTIHRDFDAGRWTPDSP